MGSGPQLVLACVCLAYRPLGMPPHCITLLVGFLLTSVIEDQDLGQRHSNFSHSRVHHIISAVDSAGLMLWKSCKLSASEQLSALLLS